MICLADNLLKLDFFNCWDSDMFLFHLTFDELFI